MAREAHPVGSFGKITRTKRKDGAWTARTYVRDLDGERRLVTRHGSSGAAAERELRKALADRFTKPDVAAGSTARIRDVAERWFADVQQAVEAGERSPNTARLYRLYLDRHILPAIALSRSARRPRPGWTRSSPP
jgi:hypothetical protein